MVACATLIGAAGYATVYGPNDLGGAVAVGISALLSGSIGYAVLSGVGWALSGFFAD